MRELLRELQNMGKTIFFSSHILSEVADICTDIGIMEAGKLVAYGDIEQMRQQLQVQRLIQVRMLGDTVPLKDILMGHDKVDSITDGRDIELTPDIVRFDFNGDDEELSQLLLQLIEKKIQIISFSEEVGDLEDVFMQATQGVVN